VSVHLLQIAGRGYVDHAHRSGERLNRVVTDLAPMGLFTLAQSRTELARLRPVLDELVVVRADVVELAAALTAGGEPTRLGGLPEWKAAQARLDELMTEVQQTGAELKGVAPLLVDFPADLDGVPVLLCWLEGEAELA
jgi:hypothetical protein